MKLTTQLKNVEMAYSKPLTHRPLSLTNIKSAGMSFRKILREPGSNNRQKEAPEKYMQLLSQKSDLALLYIGENDLETFKKKGECPATTTKSTDWAKKHFELWNIVHNAKFGDQCPEHWFEDKENLCGWLCRFV